MRALCCRVAYEVARRCLAEGAGKAVARADSAAVRSGWMVPAVRPFWWVAPG